MTLTLNEYELDLLRQRSLAARYEKARRGDLVVAASCSENFVIPHELCGQTSEG